MAEHWAVSGTAAPGRMEQSSTRQDQARPGRATKGRSVMGRAGQDLAEPGIVSKTGQGWREWHWADIIWLNSTLYFSWLTQLRLNSYPKFVNLTQLWLNSFESELNQIWLTTHCILPNLPKVVVCGGGGGVRSDVAVGWFFPCNATYKCKIFTFSLRKNQWLNFDSSSTYPVDSTLTQMTISVIRLWLDSYPWFSLPTRLRLDSFESESSQIWLTTHESSTTLPWSRSR